MDVAHKPAEVGWAENLDLRALSFGVSCVLGSIGTCAAPLFSILAREFIGSIRTIRESWKKEYALQDFCSYVSERDLSNAQELYERHARTGYLRGEAKNECLLVGIWVNEATKFLRLAEMRGQIDRSDIELYFPRCLPQCKPDEDIKLVIRALKELRHSIFKSSDIERLASDLASTSEGSKTLNLMRETPHETLDEYYQSAVI